jgi:hypothetical protein
VLLLNCGREIRYLAASSSAALEEANVGFGVTPLTGSGRERGNLVADGAATPGPYMDAPGLPSLQFMMVVRNRLHPYIRTLVAAFRRCP